MTSARPSRRVHLVGTIPAESTHDALGLVTETVGDRIAEWVPDGETGIRRNWIGRLVEGLKDNPDLELAKDGDWSDYDSTPSFRVKKGHRLKTVQLDYFDHFQASWPEFQAVRSQLGRSDLAFQIGIPGPIDVALAAFGFNPLVGFRHAGPFEEATVSEIERINAAAGAEIVYQIEIPIEVELANRIPSPLRTPGARWVARRVLRVIAEAPDDTRWGFHLCVGDMNNKSFSKLKDVGPAVKLANSLVSQFPVGRTLEFVHMPLAHGSIPPTTDARFYQPLQDLRLPPDVRFVAGFAHEKQGFEDQERIRDLIEALLGRQVDIAASCGLGRRDLAGATANLKQSRLLVG